MPVPNQCGQAGSCTLGEPSVSGRSSGSGAAPSAAPVTILRRLFFDFSDGIVRKLFSESLNQYLPVRAWADYSIAMTGLNEVERLFLPRAQKYHQRPAQESPARCASPNQTHPLLGLHFD